MAINKLNDFTAPQGPIYIDANIFLYHFAADLKYGAACSSFLNKMEQGLFRSFSSSLAIDEVVFILLRSAARELLRLDAPSQIIQQLKGTPGILKKCYRQISPSLDYLKSLTEKGVLTILDFRSPDGFIGYSLGEKYDLLPRDAAHFAIMHSQGIVNLASTDKDFKRIESIKTWIP